MSFDICFPILWGHTHRNGSEAKRQREKRTEKEREAETETERQRDWQSRGEVQTEGQSRDGSPARQKAEKPEF